MVCLCWKKRAVWCVLVFFQCARGFYRCFFIRSRFDRMLFVYLFRFRVWVLCCVFFVCSTLLYFMNTFVCLIVNTVIIVVISFATFVFSLIRVTVFIRNTFNCVFLKKKKTQKKTWSTSSFLFDLFLTLYFQFHLYTTHNIVVFFLSFPPPSSSFSFFFNCCCSMWFVCVYVRSRVVCSLLVTSSSSSSSQAFKLTVTSELQNPYVA